MIKMRSLWALLDVLVFIGAEVNSVQDSTKCSCDPEAIWINQGVPQDNQTFAPITMIPSSDGCDLTVRCHGLFPLTIASYYSKTIEGNCPVLTQDDVAILADSERNSTVKKSNATYNSLDYKCVKGNWMLYVLNFDYLADNSQCDVDKSGWVMYNNVFCVQASSKVHSAYFPELPAAEPLHAPPSTTPPALTPKQCAISDTQQSASSMTSVSCPPSISTSTKRPFPFSSTTTTRKSDTSTTTLPTSTSTFAPSTTTTVPLSTTTSKLDSTSTTTSAHSWTTVLSTTSANIENACIDGFQVVKAGYFGDGDVGGYFAHENSCRELCVNNFGMRNCIGYAFEPDNRGKCTPFERINLLRSSDSGTTTRLFVKC